MCNSSIDLQNFFPTNKLKITNILEDTKVIKISLKSQSNNCICPKCNIISNKYHGTYIKQIGLYYKYYQEFYECFNAGERYNFVKCLEEVKDKFREYFNSIDMSGKIEYSVKVAYKEYRRIFVGLELQDKLLDVDLLYNSKLRKGDRMRVNTISKNK